MGAHQAPGFVGWYSIDEVHEREGANAGRPSAIHVAVDEGVGVLAVERHQHLVQRDTARTVAIGQAREAVACAHRQAAVSGQLARCARLTGRCGYRRGGRRCQGTKLRRRGHHRRTDDWAADHLRSTRGRRRLGRRWIKEQRELAAQAAGGPANIKQQVKEGLLNGSLALHTQHGTAIRLPNQLHLRPDKTALYSSPWARNASGAATRTRSVAASSALKLVSSISALSVHPRRTGRLGALGPRHGLDPP